MNIWNVLKRYPPPVIRCYARRSTGGKHIAALTDQEISIKAGLSLARIRKIYWSSSWDKIKIDELRAFCEGCNIDPFSYRDRNRLSAYLRLNGNVPKYEYLKRSAEWESVFKPLIKFIGEQ